MKGPSMYVCLTFGFGLILSVTAATAKSGLVVFDSDESDDHEEFYDACAKKANGIRCVGIPSNCVAARNCDYGVGYWEDETHFMSTLIGPNKGKPYVAVLGFTPFQKSGNNMTASCKPKLSIGDFRVIFYKMTSSEIGNGLENEMVWTSGTSGFGKNPVVWKLMCRDILQSANEYPDEDFVKFHHLILKGEYVYLKNAGHPDGRNPLYGELPSFMDSQQYSTVDGVTFKNF